jgi:ribosomal protein S18 acetylase RimI-like enzyme
METILRPATHGDATPAGVICYAAFKAIAEQHGFPPDLPAPEAGVGLVDALLAREDVYAVIAEASGRVIGSNFLWDAESVAGVGPITVDPAAQNRSVGRKLMDAVLERARDRDIRAVRLVQAAYHTRSLSLYTKLGFESREPLSVMQGSALDLRIDGHVVRAATSVDLEAANALYRHVHGHTRAVELRAA